MCLKQSEAPNGDIWGFFIAKNMKRDWNLLHVLLAHFESESIEDFIDDMSKTDRWTEGQYFSDHLKTDVEKRKAVVYEHLALLSDGAYIKGVELQLNDRGYSCGLFHPRLTNAGHDLLQAMRSDTLWNKVKKAAKEKGIELSIQSLKFLIPFAYKQLFNQD